MTPAACSGMARLGAQLAALILSVFCLLVAAPGAVAQERAPTATAAAGEIDYDAWEVEATRAENLLAAGTASTSFFENLRQTLLDWRTRFLAAESANSERIATLQAQIDALGPEPGDGQGEPDGIATRRQQLNAQLSEAQLPRVNATEAYNRADGLIAEIDSLISQRQQDRVRELAPSPVNPANWPAAWAGLRAVYAALQTEFSERWNNPVQRGVMRGNGPLLLGLLIAALVALARGRRWTARLIRHLDRRSDRPGRESLSFLASLLQVAIPVLGTFLVYVAIVSSDMAGVLTRQLVGAIWLMTAAIYFALWLAGRFSPTGEAQMHALSFTDSQRAAAQRTIVFIGAFVGLALVAQVVSGFDQIAPAGTAVLRVFVYIGLGLLYLRAARLLHDGRTEPAPDETPGVLRRMFALVRQLLLLVGVVGPLLAVVGYVNAAEAIMVPTAFSLAVFGFIVTVQPVIRDLYRLISRDAEQDAGEALLPVLVNFFLAFAVVPLLALVWGVRPERLSEFYSRFWEGVVVGDSRITPGNVLAVILVFALGYIVTRLLQGALKNTVLPRTRLDSGARNAVTAGIGYVGIALAAVIAISAGGIDLTALGVVLGALSVGIGFGLQNVVNNFVSGIILLIERPISEGDWIEVSGNHGIVKRISVRSTLIETFDKTDLIVPNADFISGTVTNWTRGNTIGRAVINVGVAYGTDTRKVQRILQEIAGEHPVVAAYPEPGVDFVGFGPDSLDFRIRAILRDVNQSLSVKTEIHHRIAERFAEEGIEIPFAQRDIWLRNPESLRSAPPAPVDPPARSAPGPAGRGETGGQPGIEGAMDPGEDGGVHGT